MRALQPNHRDVVFMSQDTPVITTDAYMAYMTPCEMCFSERVECRLDRSGDCGDG
jgi:hypothetical protein